MPLSHRDYPCRMSDITQKIETWLKYQREIYGKFSLEKPTIANPAALRSPAPENPLESFKTLEDLRIFCETYQPLRTDLDGTNLVFGKGNPNADLMLIGEAPGETEDLRGEPFVGRAGQLLTKILEAIQFSRDDVFIANILKHRPPSNRDPLPEERQRSLPILLRQIDIIAPKIILCLGRISAQTLLNSNAAMKDLRGSFHPWREQYELTVTYHPAALLRNPNWKKDTWDDVRMVRARYDELGCKP